MSKTNSKPKLGVESFATALPGAKQFFDNQKKGAKGIRLAKQAHSKRRSLIPTNSEFSEFTKTTQKLDPNISTRHERMKFYESLFLNWLWLLQLNYNILLYGVGSKTKLLKHFVSTHLIGEDVLMISGCSIGSKDNKIVLTGDKIIKSLLETIAKKVLNVNESSSINISDNLDTYCTSIVGRLDRHYGRTRKITKPVLESEIDEHTSKKQKSMDTSFTTTSSDALKLSDMVAELKSTGDTSMKMDLQLESSVHQRKSIRPLLSKSNASLEVNPDWGKRYVHAQARLYILIDSIDGPLLRSELVIRVLSQLAACSSVSLIAASDTLNASMLWSPLQLAHFRWTYMHTPIWEPYPRRKDSGTPDASDNPNAVGEVDPDSMNDLIENNTGVKDAMGLDAILAALTESSKELLRQMMKLCTPVNTVTSTSTSTSTGSSRDPKQLTSSILKSTLLEVCKKNLILRSGVELDNQLTELVDQRIVRIDREKGRRDLDMIVCLVPLAILTAKLS